MAAEARTATPAEQQVLARWSSWGAIPQVFDETKPDWAQARGRLRAVLDDQAWSAARRTTINAHYTDPAYATAMWDALAGLGFAGGRVLEPGCGSGMFLGTAPQTAQMVGVEVDPTTAAIAAALYPGAQVRAESFADTRAADGSFDAAIGNVPFANVTLHDAAHNPGGLSMHNHFIVKSLDLVRPGGMVAVLTSSFTMDAVNPAARREMNARADLIGAIRLPAGAHRAVAGTEAVTDLLVFRVREAGTEPADRSWEKTASAVIDSAEVKLNTYWAGHPDRILGTLHVGHGMYGADTLTVTGDLDQVPGRLRQALDAVVAEARAAGQVFTDRDPDAPALPVLAPAGVGEDFEGTLAWDEQTGGFTTVENGVPTPVKVPGTQAGELRALLRLRDGARALIEAEGRTAEDTDELADARRRLHGDYDAYVARFGPINRYSLRRTGRVDKATGQETYARITPGAIRALRADPYGPLVLALENFDDQTQTAAPASVLAGRVNAPRHIPAGADTPADALALSVDATGGADLEMIADLLGVETGEARAALGELVYDDPATGTLVPAPEYLSGNVRDKLDAARTAAAAEHGDRWRVNVSALEKVQPEPIPIEDITVKLGAVWITPAEHEQFLRELLDDDRLSVTRPVAGLWKVRDANRHSLKATNEYGTDRMPASQIAEALMKQTPIVVNDEISGPGEPKKYVPNPVETEAAQVKAAAISDAFSEWAWADPERAGRLHERYNRMFNSLVLRDYTEAGRRLSTPGLAVGITLREHQRTAVARMIAEPAVGLFHQVGAGKTLEMVTGVSELRRIGAIRKPLLAVPNHMLEQFSREFLQAYPAARILAAGTDEINTAAKRRLFVARAAANDWDAIILTHSAFKSIGVSDETKTAYVDQLLADARTAADALREAGDKASVKDVEKQILSQEQKLKKLLDKHTDPGLCFEALGVDYVCVDEAHLFKNLWTPSRIPGAAIDGAQAATDLHMKLSWLRGRHGARVATLATGTPIANSITEAHVMQRYLRPDLLAEAGVETFDAWAATFGTSVAGMEIGPTGTFRIKTRFARFNNVPEMLSMWSAFADVKTGDELHLPIPALADRGDGQRVPEVVTVPASDALLAYMESLQERAERVSGRGVDPHEDNMLSISNDGRKAGLDLRLINPSYVPGGATKIGAVAERVARVWAEHRGHVYTDTTTGEPSPVTGALQLVFADLGTPRDDGGWDAYHALRDALVERGLPTGSIRFMHDAHSAEDKARLFAAARAGHVSVLVGSTQKMGMGTNVQDRIVAVHHVDCPWRPADLEQRDGRALRQGNQNDEVAIIRYTSERSFDAYMWQAVARKSAFINQIIHGKLGVREVEDIGADTLSATEVTAITSGNPLLLELATAQSDYERLRRQEVAHRRGQQSLAGTRRTLTGTVERNRADIATLTEAAGHTVDTSGEKFTARVAGRFYDARADAAAAIAGWARGQNLRFARLAEPRPLAELAGHTLVVSTRRGFDNQNTVVLALSGVPHSGSVHTPAEVENAGVGLVRQIENKAAGIGKTIARLTAEADQAQAGIADADRRLGTPFPHAAELAEAQARVERVKAAIDEQAAAAKQPDGDADTAATPPLDDRAREARDLARLGQGRPATEATRRSGSTPPAGAADRRDGRTLRVGVER